MSDPMENIQAQENPELQLSPEMRAMIVRGAKSGDVAYIVLMQEFASEFTEADYRKGLDMCIELGWIIYTQEWAKAGGIELTEADYRKCMGICIAREMIEGALECAEAGKLPKEDYRRYIDVCIAKGWRKHAHRLAEAGGIELTEADTWVYTRYEWPEGNRILAMAGKLPEADYREIMQACIKDGDISTLYEVIKAKNEMQRAEVRAGIADVTEENI